MNAITAPPRPHGHRLHHDRTSPAAARRITRATLRDWGWRPESIDRAVLVVSELVTNAVQHALPPVTLYLEPAPTGSDPPSVRLKVTDGGPGPARDCEPYGHEPDEHGRGIGLIQCLTCSTASLAQPSNSWVRVCPVSGVTRDEQLP
jgi:anti-sigma regulatory factor (Ser/Thr protein kinase)